MTSLRIIPASLEDIPVIRSIAQRTWPHAYLGTILEQPQLEYMLDLLYSSSTLEAVMMRKDQRFLLAYEGVEAGAFAGYTPHHAPGTTHLNKLYVLPEWQGRGAGHVLLERVLLEASRCGDHTVELNVNKRNKAITFYERHGFTRLRDEVIDIGSGYVMDDYVMGRPIG